MVTTDTLDLVWDLNRERPTLGGALVLRQEGELISSLNGLASVTLHVAGRSLDDPQVSPLIESVFATSGVHFLTVATNLDDRHQPPSIWPLAEERANPAFAYFSFSRLLVLSELHQLQPRLCWQPTLLRQVDETRARFGPQLVCVHLRSVAPYAPEESNAVGPVWNEFLHSRAKKGNLEFLLLGDDPLPSGLNLCRGVTRAIDAGVKLAEQLALVSRANAFLGMASGVCTAANLSATPHVIFKHPAHHSEQMRRELGSNDRFPFANFRQRIWRKSTSVELLDEALSLVLT